MAWVREGSSVTDPAFGGRPQVVRFRDSAPNNSDKTFTLGSDAGDSVLLVQRIRLEYRATSTVGTRVIAIELKDPDGDVVYGLNCNASDCPVADDFISLEFCATEREAAQNSGASRNILPLDFYVLNDWTVRVYDSAAVDAAADDMTVHINALRV